MPRLSFSGFDRSDEAQARAAFERAAPAGWTLSDEASADAVLLDLDSMYGQMAWMKGLPEGKVSIGLTRAARASTDHRLDAPLDDEALAAVLRAISGRASEPKTVASIGVPLVEATPAPVSASPMPAPEPARAPEPVPSPAPLATASSASRLASRIAGAASPFAVQHGDLPRVVIDPQRQQFAPGKSLKALLPYATLDLPSSAITALDAAEAEAALRSAGDPQPLARLVWLLALGGGEGRVVGFGPATRFQLGKWPQAEREFPKHFRIATVMLKAPATVAEIAQASGASEAEVADYVNAALAAGHASAA